MRIGFDLVRLPSGAFLEVAERQRFTRSISSRIMAIAVAASSQPAMLLSIGIVLQAYDVKMRPSKVALAAERLFA